MKSQLEFFKTFELNKTQQLNVFAGVSCVSDCEKEYKAVDPNAKAPWIKTTCTAMCAAL